ncbi:cell wall assembly regulator SMI1 [Pedobacter sp. UYEF25]
MEDEILNTYNELTKFSDSLLNFESKILDSRIEYFENKIGYNLPKDFKYFIKKSNGFSLNGTEVNGIGDEFLNSSLDKLYDFEHNEVGNPMPKYFMPFSADGYGNHYCIDLSRTENEICPIVFWQHDCNYKNISEVETCNNNFVEWVNKVMIEWTLEEYNYDGTEK